MGILLASFEGCLRGHAGQKGGVLSGSAIRTQQVALLPPWPLYNPSEIELSQRVTDSGPWRLQFSTARKSGSTEQESAKPNPRLEEGAVRFQLGQCLWSLCFQRWPQAVTVAHLGESWCPQSLLISTNWRKSTSRHTQPMSTDIEHTCT